MNMVVSVSVMSNTSQIFFASTFKCCSVVAVKEEEKVVAGWEGGGLGRMVSFGPQCKVAPVEADF